MYSNIREMKHERLLIIMNFKIFFIVHPMIISCKFSDPMAYCTCYDICPCKFSDPLAYCTCYDICPCKFSDPLAYCTCYDIFPCNFSDPMAIVCVSGRHFFLLATVTNG